MNSRGLVLLCCLWWVPMSVPAQITIDAVPGGIVEIPLGPVSDAPPKAFFGQRRILVTPSGPEWVGIVGLPLSLVPGRYVVRTAVDDDPDPVAHEFTVFPRRTREQPMIERPDLAPSPRAGDLPWRSSLDAELPLAPPLTVPAQPLFGRLHRNSTDDSRYLEFVVFSVTTDSPVAAPGGGRVQRTESLEAGVYVWVDHGMGLFTRTGPLTRTSVSPGDPLQPGQTLGRIILHSADRPGSLYWSVFLNGTAVNPFLLSNLKRAPLPDPAPGAS